MAYIYNLIESEITEDKIFTILESMGNYEEIEINGIEVSYKVDGLGFDTSYDYYIDGHWASYTQDSAIEEIMKLLSNNL